MSLSDPIGDMLARIKNAQVRNHSKVSLPSSKFKSKYSHFKIVELINILLNWLKLLIPINFAKSLPLPKGNIVIIPL